MASVEFMYLEVFQVRGFITVKKWVEDQNQIVLQLLEQILQPMPLLRQHLDSQNRVALCSLLASVILSLLLSSNFITAALVAVIAGLYWFFFMSRKKASTPQPNTNATRPTQPVPISPPSTPTPFQSAPSSNDIDVKVAVAEVEHLITEIDNTTDKVKLPSIYRKLMSIIYKLEKINGVEIKGLPIEIAKKRILENYRRRLNS